MNTLMTLALAGTLALSGITTVASAQYRGNDVQIQHDRDGRQDGGWGRGGYGSRFDLTGTWRLDSRQGDIDAGYGRGHGYGRRGRSLDLSNFALPNVIQLQRWGREVRVQAGNGQTLRMADLGRFGSMTATGRGARGATFTEEYSLRNGGRQLVVHTTVTSGWMGSREFTSVYHRI
jgi:hypothetical protein